MYCENDKQITIVSNKVIATLNENCYTINVFYYKNCDNNTIIDKDK